MASNAMTHVQSIFNFSLREPDTALSPLAVHFECAQISIFNFVTSLSLSISLKLRPENVLGVSILPPILSKRDET